MDYGFSKELQLLIDILKSENDNHSISIENDQDKFVWLLSQHRVVSAVFTKLNFENDNHLSELLAQQYRTNKLNQLHLVSELTAVSQLFESIDFLVLKGPVLSQILYNDPAERTSRDLDILIDQSDLEVCSDLLISRGYEQITKFNTPKQKKAILKNYHHIEFFNKQNGVLIELHWNLTSFKTFNFNLKNLWSRTKDIGISNYKFRTLTDEDLLAYLALHGTFHNFSRLQWLNDIFQFCKNHSRDENEIIYKKLSQESIYPFVLIALSLLNKLFDMELPEFIQRDIEKNDRVQKLVAMSINEINLNSLKSVEERERFERMMRNHKVQYYAGGVKGLIKSITSRNVRPANWEVFAFSDKFFGLNNLFSRIIWFFGKTRKK